MKRSLPLAVVALLLVSCQAQQSLTGETIVIAADISTATFAPARTWDQAMRFAIQRVGTVGRFHLVYRPFDNSLGGEQNALRGHENVDRAIEDTAVLGLIGPLSTPLAHAELPDGNRAPLAMVSPTATGNCLTVFDPACAVTAYDLRPTGRVTFFRLPTPDIGVGRAMGAYAAKKGLRSVAIFNEFGPGGRPYVNGFREVFEQSGGHVVLVQDLPAGTASFTSFLDDARKRGVDAIYAIADGDQGPCQAALQMKTLLPGVAFLANDGIALNSSCIKDIGADAAEGIVANYPDVDSRNSTDPAVVAQAKAYTRAYPKQSDVNIYTFAVYDATMLLIDAIRRAITQNDGARPSRQQVIDAVAATQDFAGVTGTYSFDANGDAKSPLMSIYRVEGGKWVQVSP